MLNSELREISMTTDLSAHLEVFSLFSIDPQLPMRMFRHHRDIGQFLPLQIPFEKAMAIAFVAP